MNKKIIIGSILAAVLIVLASMSSVVGYKSSDKSSSVVDSPLFATRVNKILNKDTKKINSKYIGHRNTLSLFIEKKSSFQSMIDRATKILNAKPDLIDKVFDKLISMPEIISILNENNVNIDKLRTQVNAIKNNPEMMKESIDVSVASLPFDSSDPIPLGLSTSNPLECIIVAIILLPVFVMLGAIIATLTIVTCLNLNGCFETLIQNLIEGLTQGFDTPSDLYI